MSKILKLLRVGWKMLNLNDLVIINTVFVSETKFRWSCGLRCIIFWSTFLFLIMLRPDDVSHVFNTQQLILWRFPIWKMLCFNYFLLTPPLDIPFSVKGTACHSNPLHKAMFRTFCLLLPPLFFRHFLFAKRKHLPLHRPTDSQAYTESNLITTTLNRANGEVCAKCKGTDRPSVKSVRGIL